MSEPEQPVAEEATKIASTTIPMSAARQCAKCFVISEEPKCPVCAGETTLLVIPQHILLDQLVRHFVTHLSSLGSKIEALTEEIRVKNQIEDGKRKYSVLKNKVLASLSKTLSEEAGDEQPGEVGKTT